MWLTNILTTLQTQTTKNNTAARTRRVSSNNLKAANLSLSVDLRDEHNRVRVERLLVTQSRVLLQPAVLLQRGILHLLHVGHFNVIVFFILRHSTARSQWQCCYRLVTTIVDANMQLTINSFRLLFPRQDFPLTLPWLLVKSLIFPDSCEIPWHFQVFPEVVTLNGKATRCGKKNFLKICLLVSTEYRNVMDRQTDTTWQHKLRLQHCAAPLSIFRPTFQAKQLAVTSMQ